MTIRHPLPRPVRHRLASWLGGALLMLAAGFGWASVVRAEPAATDWGWPQPYQQISEKSKNWLKDQGLWPLSVGFQAPWTGENALNIVVDKLDLLGKRGIDNKFQFFNSGPDLIEAFTANRIQVGSSGNFPYHSLLDRKVPARGILNYPLLTHATIVPNDSPLHSLKDLKGSNPPAVIGIVTGSSAEFYFQAAAAANGLEIGKDVILKNLPLSEQLQLPAGVAAVVPWDLTASLLIEQRRTGRAIDTSHPYNLYEGIGFVRQEVIDGAPDVVQAIADSFVEAALWIRLHPDQAVTLLHEHPALKGIPEDFLASQIAHNNNLFKPTFLFPQPAFWAVENERIRAWLKARNRLTRDLTAEEYVASYAPEFIATTFKTLGWKTPARPVYLPAGWTGQIGTVPYPPYFNQTTATAPQPFPEPGDLERPWSFDGKTYQP
jgi:sulfonate transport system substrate-binding protein